MINLKDWPVEIAIIKAKILTLEMGIYQAEAKKEGELAAKEENEYFIVAYSGFIKP